MISSDSFFTVIKKQWAVVAAVIITLIAFFLRFWLFRRYHNPLMLHEQDGIAYMSNALALLSFKLPNDLYMPPFYSFVIALFSLLPVKLETAARVASITMDALVVLPLYGLARIFLARLPALAVCGLWATFSFSLFYAPSPLSQSTYLLMLLSGTYFLYRASTNGLGYRFYWASGACLCAAYQTRPEGIVALGAGLALIALSALQGGADRRRQVKGAVFFAVAFALCALPYILALHAKLGHWTFTAKTTVAIMGIDGSLTLGSAGGKAKSGVELWLEHFGGVSGGINFIIGNITAFFNLLLKTFPAWTHVFALAGLLFMLISKKFVPRLFPLLLFVVTIPVYVANLPKGNAYIYPLFPLYLLALVVGIQGMLSLAGKGVNRLLPALSARVLSTLLALLLLLPTGSIAMNAWREVNANFTAADYLNQVDIADKIMRIAGEDVKTFSLPGEYVMTRWGLISYFADRPLMVLPKGSIDEVLAYGRKNGARLLVIDSGAVDTRRQELLELLNPLFGKGIDPRYRLRVVAARINDVGGYVIYRYM
jgi:hypothetical protein